MDEGDELTLAAPAFDHIIERPRLIAAIEEADARLVLLCAPAGYGKTTLARQWSAREKRQPLWYRTTRASGDVAALAVRLDTMLAGAVGAPKNRDPNRIASIASVNPKPDPLGRALVSTYKRLPKSLLVVVRVRDRGHAGGGGALRRPRRGPTGALALHEPSAPSVVRAADDGVRAGARAHGR